MSWSISIEATAVEDFAAKADAARAAANIHSQNPDGADQADLAVRIAKEIVASGVIAGPGRKVVATLCGHANPDHSGDSMSVSVYEFVEYKCAS